MVKGESVFLIILSKLCSVFPLMAFLNSSISFLISLRRSELTSSGVLVRFSLLSSLSSLLTSVRLSSCYSRCLISWFCLVSSSIVVASDWICRANAAWSGLLLVSIWTCELIGTNHVLNSIVPTDDAKLMMLWSLVERFVQIGTAHKLTWLQDNPRKR